MTLKFGNSRHGLLDHRSKRAVSSSPRPLVGAVDLEAQAGGEVLLVADHDIDVAGERAVDLARAVLPADGLPEPGPVVEVVRDDGAVARGRSDRLLDDVGRGLGERGEDAAGVEPAHAERAEEVVPVDVAGLELRRGGVSRGRRRRPRRARRSRAR